MKKLFTNENFTSAVFYLAILIFIIGFNFTDTPPPFGWYQQFMPNLNGMPVSDIFFLDSLTGWSVTGTNSGPGHINYILKTTNGGDNWNIVFTDTSFFSKVKFIDSNTGYSSGGSGGGTGYLYKSTNGGVNWVRYVYGIAELEDMSVLNKDTLWVVDHDPLTGGVFRTTNGGANWVQQLALGISNPDHIYMFNGRIGFISKTNSYLRKTTDGGQSWFVILNNEAFSDMHFIDSLVGWKSDNGTMKKTTDGGLTWINQQFPVTYAVGIIKFSNVNNDTIWGVGGIVVYPNNQGRGIIYKTTNGGNNWGYQIPDTNIHVFEYLHNKFINKLNGWAYSGSTGVHTVTGGNDTTYSGIKNISSQIPKEFKLYQNYPNPFNPKTKIRYEIRNHTSEVRLILYDITGKEITILVNQKPFAIDEARIYEVEFDGSNFSSGVYFYSLIVDGQLIDTKKMILLK
ncbi:MAG: T9SS type A sorting domain-containing protein [Ignavibacteria bacterium]|jgi:photosystem II stability/assembly factor-like uncharacterized protein